jgi:uncharacterized repeat protein (TIGR01451 family)
MVKPGGSITYDISYSNIGNIALSGLVITDTLPVHTAFDASASPAGWTQVGAKAVDRYVVPSLAVSATGHISFTVRLESQNPPAASFVTNSVQIGYRGAHGPDANLDNNTALISTSTQAAYWVYFPVVSR